MKKTIIICALSLFMVMCKSTKTQPSSVEKQTEINVQYRDNFPSATDAQRKDFLQKLKATDAASSVLIFTQGYKGEKIIVNSGTKTIYTDYVMSDLKTKVAGYIRISNTADTKVYDNYTKKEVVIPAKKAQKYKFVYLMKKNGSDPFYITYSNTLLKTLAE